MRLDLEELQAEAQGRFHEFARREIAPYADLWDREEKIPGELVRKLAAENWLGPLIPAEYGGAAMDMITFGLLNEEIGRACSSVRSLLTVHGMVQYAILRWGSQSQKQTWLPRMARGQAVGAFALSEPHVGSDARSLETTATPYGSAYRLRGTKAWITFGQIADVFLLFAQCQGAPTAFLLERDTPGLSFSPISGLLGTRASMLATLQLDDCEIPQENRVGGVGFGLSTVGAAALDIGRYSVASGCVGIAQACLDAATAYAGSRKQFGHPLKDHQLIRKMITEMAVNVRAARLLCYQAGYLKDTGDPRTVLETLVAKYFAARIALESGSAAVQIHGANGCGAAYSVQRYFRDAKVMEIIEGSTQIQELMISKQVCDTLEVGA
jgi:alkylation response protein AidB-like acyl-CoA dehydrogenase